MQSKHCSIIGFYRLNGQGMTVSDEKAVISQIQIVT